MAHFEYLTAAGDMTPRVFLFTIGLSVDLRGGDGTIADRTLAQVLQRAATDLSAQGRTEAVAFGNIHTANVRSQDLVKRAGFQPDERIDQYQRWSLAFHW